MNITSSAEPTETQRWLVVGAYQAGATEKEVACIKLEHLQHQNEYLTEVSELQYMEITEQKKDLKWSRIAKKRTIVEYDEAGNVIDIDDENSWTDEEEPGPSKTWRLTKRRRRITKRLTARDIMVYVLHKSRSQTPMYHEETNINPDANHNSKEWNDKNNGNPWRPPTPPRDNNHRTSSGMERDRPSTFLPPSPPLNGLEINSSDSLEKKKHDHKSWTLKDDKILLHHVLSRLHGGRWQEAETKLGGRHTARQCAERWQHLKKLLLKGIDKTGTQGWVK